MKDRRIKRMLQSAWEIFLLILLFFAAIKVARAGTVRTIYVDSKTMSPIHLKLGESTLLRFNEKPKKVVIGNSNYFNVEFVESDVTIQPLGRNSTNLFVYGQDHTYGFLLSVGPQGYDDLVMVKWRGMSMQGAPSKESKTPMKVSKPNMGLDLGKNLKVIIEKIQGPTLFGMHTIDVVIENDMPVEIKTKEIPIFFVSGTDGPQYKGEWAFDEASVKPKSKLHARFVGKLDRKKNLQVMGRYLGIKNKVLIPMRFL